MLDTWTLLVISILMVNTLMMQNTVNASNSVPPLRNVYESLISLDALLYRHDPTHNIPPGGVWSHSCTTNHHYTCSLYNWPPCTPGRCMALNFLFWTWERDRFEICLSYTRRIKPESRTPRPRCGKRTKLGTTAKTSIGVGIYTYKFYLQASPGQRRLKEG